MRHPIPRNDGLCRGDAREGNGVDVAELGHRVRGVVADSDTLSKRVRKNLRRRRMDGVTMMSFPWSLYGFG
jgi:hypothetical protein